MDSLELTNFLLILLIICGLIFTLLLWKANRRLWSTQAENGRKLYAIQRALEKDADVNFECLKQLKDIYLDTLEINRKIGLMSKDFDRLLNDRNNHKNQDKG